MERHVKERLIGAAVLVAAAVILIPEMLSGPADEPATAQRPMGAGDAPLKTYTIDLSKSASQATAAASEPVSSAAPPPEGVAGEADSIPDAPDQAIPESGEGSSQTVTPKVSEEPAVSTPAVVQPSEPAPVASSAPAPPVSANGPTGAGWAVQLGSFSTRATADGLAGRVKGDGFPAFVMPVKSGGKTLYRVRIGPLPDRESATAVLGKVKGSVPAATVVKHP